MPRISLVIIACFSLTFPLYAADFTDFCSTLTEQVNRLILSDEDSENDWEAYAEKECECEIGRVREKFGDDYAERYARYTEMGMQIDIKVFSSPHLTDDQLIEWVSVKHPHFFELENWADELLESWADELNLNALEDPLEVCWE